MPRPEVHLTDAILEAAHDRPDARRNPKTGKTEIGLVIQHGMRTKNALLAAAGLGCTVTKCRGHGHYMVAHPSQDRRCQVDPTRKDAPRALTAYLNRIVRTTLNDNAPDIDRPRRRVPEAAQPEPTLYRGSDLDGPARSNRDGGIDRRTTQGDGDARNGDTAMSRKQRAKHTPAKTEQPSPTPTPTPTPKPSIARNVLQTHEVIALADFIRERWGTIVNDKPTPSAFAEAAAASLAFTITGANVKNATAGCKLEWPVTENGDGDPRLADHAISLSLMEGLIVRLIEGLGDASLTGSPEYRALRGRIDARAA